MLPVTEQSHLLKNHRIVQVGSDTKASENLIACSCTLKRWFLKGDQHSLIATPTKAHSWKTLLAGSPSLEFI